MKILDMLIEYDSSNYFLEDSNNNNDSNDGYNDLDNNNNLCNNNDHNNLGNNNIHNDFGDNNYYNDLGGNNNIVNNNNFSNNNDIGNNNNIGSNNDLGGNNDIVDDNDFGNNNDLDINNINSNASNIYLIAIANESIVLLLTNSINNFKENIDLQLLLLDTLTTIVTPLPDIATIMSSSQAPRHKLYKRKCVQANNLGINNNHNIIGNNNDFVDNNKNSDNNSNALTVHPIVIANESTALSLNNNLKKIQNHNHYHQI
ncbi:hypothetical protein F8M41_019963 [Gigaspora margarita]|uniref:Uncharacterized protein n=1 Tax=Gigaspora margarita TaxID=4874 RepID=A0A8H4EK13_GIGMA|nr:hypothetical protein F8M41_019963 [Gigaspora margarita]